MRKIGVIGLGSIGMRHAKNLVDMGCWVHAWDPDEAKCKEIMLYRPADTSNILPVGWCDDIGEVSARCDAIVIASPTHLHLDHIMSCKFKTPLFVEKPLIHKFEDDILLGGHITVGYNLRFHSCVKKAKEWLDAGLIGEPLWASFTCAQYNDKPAYLRDGVILNWSHEIDLALYLLGAAKVKASSTRLTDGRDDMADILLTHDSGTMTHIHLDYITADELRGFTIVGKKGAIKVTLLGGGVATISDDAEDGYSDLYCPENSFDANYVEEMQAFIDRIDGKETLGATGEEGLAVLRICLEVRKQAGL